MTEIFKIENVNLYYDHHHVLKNINIALYKNQITALIGPSGCGKSTFLRCFNRMNDLIESCKETGNIT
ncbi:MAG: ATP-binding cassette domain-containing protein, partial [Bacilli bacterium]